jgi:hypothetical protein
MTYDHNELEREISRIGPLMGIDETKRLELKLLLEIADQLTRLCDILTKRRSLK